MIRGGRSPVPIKFHDSVLTYPGSSSYVCGPVAQQIQIQMSFLTDMFICPSQVWQLYSWVNHDTCIDILLHSNCSEIIRYFMYITLHMATHCSQQHISPIFPIFPDHFQIPRLFQFFQLGGHPHHNTGSITSKSMLAHNNQNSDSSYYNYKIHL